MVDHVLFFEGTVALIVFFAILAVSIFAFVNSLLYSADSYDAAGKLNKTTWCTILGFGMGLQLLGLFGIVGMPFLITLALLIAAFVYLADVRPALAGLYRR